MENQESRKTAIYVLVAGMALLVAWEPWRPAPPDHSAPPEVGTKLFETFKDPLAAKSLEVVRFDEDTATIHPFKVAQIDGVWSIPSHSGYPADAQDHMAEAATSLIDLEILGMVSDSPGDQELYGVVSPDPQTLRSGMTGVGTRVSLKDKKDKVLADLVVGKQVKDQPQLRYVREADRDLIYVVKLNTDRFSTKFEDWIEEDLLKLNAFDVRNVSLNDYSIQEAPTAQGRMGLRMNPRSKMTLAYDDTKSTWSLVEMSEVDGQGQPVPTTLGEGEELDNEKLNALKSALDDLQIVDVQRKPKGLSQDLRASDEFVKDNEAQASLISRGFYPVPVDDHVEVYSSEGEATCTTKDGVRYVLRFGRIAGGLDTSDEGAEQGEGEDAEPKSDPSLNRFLFVMAQFDESQIPKPELQPVPGAEGTDENPPAEDQPAEEKPADEAKSDDESTPQDDAEPTSDEPASEDASSDTPDEESVPETKTAAQEESNDPADATEAKEPDDAGEPAEQPASAAAEAPAESDDKGEGDASDEAKSDDAPKSAATPSPEEVERVAIERENKRRQEEYDEAVKKGQDKVNELNDRFADWYFIISDDVYQKIHIGRDDVVKKKQVEDAVDALGDPELKDLQQGLDAK